MAKQSVSKKKLTVPLPWQRKGGSKTFFWNDLTLTLLVVRRPSMSDTFTLHYIYTLKPHTRAFLLYVYQTRLVRDRLNSRPHAYLGLRPRKLRNASYYHRPCHDIVSSRFLLFPSASLPFPSLPFPTLPSPPPPFHLLPPFHFTFLLPFPLSLGYSLPYPSAIRPALRPYLPVCSAPYRSCLSIRLFSSIRRYFD